MGGILFGIFTPTEAGVVVVVYVLIVGALFCAAAVPAERLLIETDSPYLSPEPVRGKKPNEPAHLSHTAQCLAKTRGVSLEELAAITTSNAQVLFGI